MNNEDSKGGEIFKVIPQIIGEIAPISKDRKNRDQGYSFRSVEQIYTQLQSLLAKYSVTIVPVVREVERTVGQTRSGSRMNYITGTMSYNILAKDGSSITAVVPAEAMDTSDKSAPKFCSMAYKYMAFQVFCIPVDEGLDTEHASPEMAPEPEGAPVPAKRGPTRKTKINRLTKLFGDNLDAVVRYLGPDGGMKNAEGKQLMWLAPGEGLDKLTDEHLNWIVDNTQRFSDLVQKWVEGEE